MTMATIKLMMNAAPAVINQPPITVITPVMRNTALSRVQARSAKLEPMATINVTKVVDKGNLNEVGNHSMVISSEFGYEQTIYFTIFTGAIEALIKVS